MGCWLRAKATIRATFSNYGEVDIPRGKIFAASASLPPRLIEAGAVEYVSRSREHDEADVFHHIDTRRQTLEMWQATKGGDFELESSRILVIAAEPVRAVVG